jgi:hypothetical protein
MLPFGIKDKFDLYQKWFKTLLIKEFMNLPTKYQEKFLEMVEKFHGDCKKIHVESKIIQEKTITLTVTKVVLFYNELPGGTEEKFRVYCKSSQLKDKVILTTKYPEPKIGDKICHTVFSLDKDGICPAVWYSSKEELITKTQRSSL